jgi:hypothetical protein
MGLSTPAASPPVANSAPFVGSSHAAYGSSHVQHVSIPASAGSLPSPAFVPSFVHPFTSAVLGSCSGVGIGDGASSAVRSHADTAETSSAYGEAFDGDADPIMEASPRLVHLLKSSTSSPSISCFSACVPQAAYTLRVCTSSHKEECNTIVFKSID